MIGAPSAVNFRISLASLALVLLAGCVSPEVQKQRARVVECRAALDTHKPSNRAELNKLLPATAKVEAHEAELDFLRCDGIEKSKRGVRFSSSDVPIRSRDWAGYFIPATTRNVGNEIHRLGDGLVLSVNYEYRHYRVIRSVNISGVPGKSGAGVETIDSRLFYPHTRVCRVYPSPIDRVVTPPTLLAEMPMVFPGPSYTPLSAWPSSSHR